MTARVLACIVAYQPHADSLSALIERLSQDADAVLVIDNGQTLAPADPRWADHGKVVWRRPSRNLGVAGALNIAVAHAASQGFAYLHTFDQDSQPPAGLTGRLLAHALREPRVAAWGPVLVDRASGRQFASMPPLRWLRRKVLLAPGERLSADHLITSGCLFPVDTLKRVGLFNEDLFIDYVDVEWSLRARRAGLALVQVGAERMPHTIGSSTIALLGARLAVHSPLRSYYQARNAVWLAMQRSLPLSWRLNDVVRSTQKFVLLLLLAGQRAQRLRCIGQGLRDAFTLRPMA